MAASRVAGTAYFKIDGAQQSYRGSAKIQLSMIKREPITNMDRSINFKETPQPGTMELEFTTIPGFNAASLNSITNSTLTFEAANGSVYILQSGFQTDDITVDADEGKVTAKFAGTVIEA